MLSSIFPEDQHRIYDAWQERGAKLKRWTRKPLSGNMADLEHMLAAMCGGG
ncbi:MAG: hypothetical protein ACLSEY_15385 [Enterocloster sp.]